MTVPPLSPSIAHLAVVRSWVGENVGHDGDLYDAVDIAGRIGRLGSPEAAALELLRTIHAGMLSDPSTLTVFGDVSISQGDNLKQVEAKISKLEALTGEGTVRFAQMTRSTIVGPDPFTGRTYRRGR